MITRRSLEAPTPHAAAIAAVPVLGAGIRWFRIEHTSLWLDELAQVAPSPTHLAGHRFNYKTFTPRIHVFFPIGGCEA
jgi:hypothetical protein